MKKKKKLNLKIAREIRRRHNEGDITQRELAVDYKVSTALICKILKNQSYFDRFYVPRKRPPIDIELAKSLRESGMSYGDIASELRRALPDDTGFYGVDTIRQRLLEVTK